MKTLNLNIQKTNAALVFITLMFAAVYSCFSQVNTLAYHDQNGVQVSHREAEYQVRLASDVRLNSSSSAMNAEVNSPYEDLKPTLAPCGKRLYFSRSGHPYNVGGVNDLEDIWYVDYNDETRSWSQPVRMTGVLNNAGPNFICNVSATGDTLILGNQYSRKGRMRAGVSYSVNVNGQWSDPQPINIKNDYNISEHANYYVSLKTGVIVSAIQREETYGERDLYVSFWNGIEATEPVNMGGVINSEMDESSPFLAADGKTLYFASKGHNGFGGYDIWVTHRLDDSWTNWTKPENLGPAVNGELDDEFFSITQDGNYAVFSKQISVHNHDLYRISTRDLFVAPVKGVKFEESKDASVAGL